MSNAWCMYYFIYQIISSQITPNFKDQIFSFYEYFDFYFFIALINTHFRTQENDFIEISSNICYPRKAARSNQLSPRHRLRISITKCCVCMCVCVRATNAQCKIVINSISEDGAQWLICIRMCVCAYAWFHLRLQNSIWDGNDEASIRDLCWMWKQRTLING